MSIHSEAELHRKYVAFAKLLNIYLNHFPKHEKYALYKFKHSVKKGKLESCISILGHAKQTASLNHLLTYAKETNNDLYRSLPKTYHRLHHYRAAPG